MLVSYLAEKILNAKWKGKDVDIEKISSLEEATEASLSFIDSPRKAELALKSRAPAFLVPQGVEIPGKTVVEVPDPREALIKLAPLFWREEHAAFKPGVSSLAFMEEGARIARSAHIGPFTQIKKGAQIGEKVVIYGNCYIGQNVKIGEGTVIFPGVVIYQNCEIGKNVRIHSGAVIGADGFGYHKGKKIPQMGKVVIEDNVEIGANTCIDRATLGTTRIEKNVKIDNLVQIGHNVKIGENTIIVAQVGISGSCKIGKNVVMAGQVGVADHVEIADNVILGAKSGVPSSLKEPGMYLGIPVFPARLARRIIAAMARLPEVVKRVLREEK